MQFSVPHMPWCNNQLRWHASMQPLSPRSCALTYRFWFFVFLFAFCFLFASIFCYVRHALKLPPPRYSPLMQTFGACATQLQLQCAYAVGQLHDVAQCLLALRFASGRISVVASGLKSMLMTCGSQCLMHSHVNASKSECESIELRWLRCKYYNVRYALVCMYVKFFFFIYFVCCINRLCVYQCYLCLLHVNALFLSWG